MRRLFCALTAFAVSLSLQLPARAQTPADITNPASDAGIPARIQSLELPEVQFEFGNLLDPQRLSLIETVTEQHLNDPRLSEAAQSVIRNHMIALQQVELAILFLQANRDNIVAGTNQQFNDIFGNPGKPRDVAVTSSQPLSGLADVSVNAMTGQIQLDFDDATFPNVPGQLNLGDFVYVGDATLATPTGFVAEVEEILFDTDGTNQMVLANAPFGTPMTATMMNGIPVYRIIRFDRQGDPTRYDRVLMTFQSIKEAMSGISPGLQASLVTTGQPITYRREFVDINTVWMPGQASFTPLDPLVQNLFNNLSTLNLNSTRGADRLVRQAGFSNSDSHLHLDRLRDQATGQTTDYLGRPTLPLLWTEDNELPLLPPVDLASNVPVPGSTDEDRAFFNNRQTIFGAPDNPFEQFIGRAFLEESIIHAGEFDDDQVAVEPGTLATIFVRGRRPQRNPQQFEDLNNNGTRGDLGDFEFLNLAESGTPTTEQTELRKWQMIIASFAEHNTDLTRLDVAVFGLGSMFGGFTPSNFRAQDAGNFGRFAGLIGGSSLGSINPRRIEPFGKRGGAGFFPVVPRQ